jgi:hypothetical protein
MHSIAITGRAVYGGLLKTQSRLPEKYDLAFPDLVSFQHIVVRQ